MAIEAKQLDPDYDREPIVRFVGDDEIAEILKKRIDIFLLSARNSGEESTEYLYLLKRGTVFIRDENGKLSHPTLAAASLVLQRAGLWVMMTDYDVDVNKSTRRHVVPKRDLYGTWPVEYCDFPSRNQEGLIFRREAEKLGTTDAKVVWSMKFVPPKSNAS